jgi:hypothetical protein
MTNKGNEFALAFDLQAQDAKAAVGIVEGNALDQPLKAIQLRFGCRIR